MTQILIDCDTGIDDALAILYLAAQPHVEIVAAGTVHGNVPPHLGALNTLRVLDVAGLNNVPVAVGAARPFAQPVDTAIFVHGADGLGDTNLPQPTRRPSNEAAATQLVRLAHAHPGALTIVATGPLTNIAIALLLEPELPRLLAKLVVMGGALYVPGNMNFDAEANIWHDPESADLVLSAGFDLILVGLDVTNRAIATASEIDSLRSRGRKGLFVWTILQKYLDYHQEYYGDRFCHLHDPLAAAIAVDPGLAEFYSTPVRVELRGEMTRGATRGNPREKWEGTALEGPNVSVAVEAQFDEFKAKLFEALARE